MTTTHTWSPDYKDFEKQIAAQKNAADLLQKDTNSYHSKVMANFDKYIGGTDGKKPTPEKVLLYFFYFVMASLQPSDAGSKQPRTDTIFGLEDDKMGAIGQNLGLTAKTTQLINDLQNITNGTSTDPNNSLKDVAKNLDQLMHEFDPSNTNGLSGHGFSPDAAQQIFGSLQTIRSTIYVEGENPYGYGPKPTDSTVFFSDATGKLSSFSEMIKDLGQKGDPDQATEASKTLSDSFSVLTSTTQGVNSALNEQVSQQTGFQKNVQSFGASLMKSMIDLMNSIIQSTSK
jgi:hypothetical protein